MRKEAASKQEFASEKEVATEEFAVRGVALEAKSYLQ
jgi:hypothetical protein